mmetsp:Transcript_7061/g.9896  ORF Transcript_7061/g.9896 Transcript_7061/m.9896 type:complete len:304 (-) Transcript_7061:364-1275(-)
MVLVLVPRKKDGSIGKNNAPSSRMMRENLWLLESQLGSNSTNQKEQQHLGRTEFVLKSFERLKKRRRTDEHFETGRKKVAKLIPLPKIKTVRPVLCKIFAKGLMSGSSFESEKEASKLKQRVVELRNELWSSYVKAVSENIIDTIPKPGDYTDASTFDFMSYIQFTALNEQLPSSQASSHELKIAQSILALLDFHESHFSSPKEVVSSLLQSMVSRGYAAKFRVLDRDDRPNTLRCDLALPANLWSSAALRRTKAACSNDFHILATRCALHKFGLDIIDLDSRFSSDGKLAFFFSLQPLVAVD